MNEILLKVALNTITVKAFVFSTLHMAIPHLKLRQIQIISYTVFHKKNGLR